MGKRLFAKDEDSIEVEVQIDPAFAHLLSTEDLRSVAEVTLQLEGKSGEVTLVITGDPEIQRLNRDFLGIDAPTDVLAFSAQEIGDSFVAAPEAGDYLGDVIVSYPRAVGQAAELGHPVGQEINLLVVHGVLHLLGYDHADEDEKEAMWARQEVILRRVAADAAST
jgi:probable rRNA maturation factor